MIGSWADGIPSAAVPSQQDGAQQDCRPGGCAPGRLAVLLPDDLLDAGLVHRVSLFRRVHPQHFRPQTVSAFSARAPSSDADPGEGFVVERIVDPAAVAAVLDEAGVFERPHVEGQPRLAGVERVRQVADALLAGEEPADDPEAGLVGEGVEEPRQPPQLVVVRQLPRNRRPSPYRSIYLDLLICQGRVPGNRQRASSRSASARRSRPPSPDQALPCMQASVVGASAANRSRWLRVAGACA